jgi:plastocyanin
VIRVPLVFFLVGAGFAACGKSSSTTREIAVDYRNDDFNGIYLAFFPRKITVSPGTTLKFHQTWSGEPHTVSLGTSVNDAVKPFKRLIDEYYVDPHSIESEPESAFDGFTFAGRLPTFFDQTNFETIDQAAALPCYVNAESQLPHNNKPCAAKDRQQVPFTGRQAYYSSGFIPFEGTRGNTWDMKIADDAKEGTYFYYCNLHSIFMSGEIAIKKDAKVESQVAINRRGRAEADKLTKPVLRVYRKEVAGKGKFAGNLAGSGDNTTDFLHAAATEFTPRVIKAKAGEPVKWTFIGDHTISFNVPPYAPLFKYAVNGHLRVNRALYDPKALAGAPRDRVLDNDHPPPAVDVDAGTWDGTGGMHSSGAGWVDGDTYTIRFSRKGTYRYACLIHPGMLGTVEVS